MNILLICGSDRKESLNMQLARMAENDLKERVHVSMLNYADLPLFSQDLEYPAPESITRIRDEVAKANVLWFFCPEYNGNITPRLINLVDWLSRPATPKSSYLDCVLRGRIYTISGIGGKRATALSQEKLTEMLNFLGMKGLNEKDAHLSMNPAVFKSGNLSDLPEAKAAIKEQAEYILSNVSEADE